MDSPEDIHWRQQQQQQEQQQQQQQFQTQLTTGSGGSLGLSSSPTVGSSPHHDVDAFRRHQLHTGALNVYQSMPVMSPTAPGRIRHSMPPLAVQATEDSRREDVMNETRRQSREWTEMSEAVLEARNKCAGLEAQLSKLSMQLFQNIRVHTVTAHGEIVSITEEAEGKK